MRGLLLALGLAAGAVHGAHPLVTEDTGTQGAGGWQLEVNSEWLREESARAVLPTATLAYGVTEAIDMQLTTAYLDIEGGSSGVLDTVIEAKWRFHERDPLSLALMPGVRFATGDETRGMGAGRTGWGVRAIASYEPKGDWALHAHAGYTENRNRIDERVSLWEIAGALVWQASASLKLAIDLSALSNPAGGGALRQVVLGAIYAVSDDLDLDIGVRWSSEAAVDEVLLAGVTLRW